MTRSATNQLTQLESPSMSVEVALSGRLRLGE